MKTITLQNGTLNNQSLLNGYNTDMKANFDELYNGDNDAWLNLYRTTSTATTHVIPEGQTTYTLFNRLFPDDALFNYGTTKNMTQIPAEQMIPITREGNYLFLFDADVQVDTATELNFIDLVYGIVGGVSDSLIGVHINTKTIVDFETINQFKHIGINAIIKVVTSGTSIPDSISLGVKHSYAGDVTLTIKTSPKLTLIYLGV